MVIGCGLRSIIVVRQHDGGLMNPRMFRLLLVAGWAMIAITFVVGLRTDVTLPTPLREFVTTRTQQMPWWRVEIGAIVVMIALWNTYELFHFRPRGRPILLVLIALAVFSTPLWGPMIASGWVGPSQTLAWMIPGAVAVAAYSPPLTERFLPGVRAA
jgi:hypothetical protein